MHLHFPVTKKNTNYIDNFREFAVGIVANDVLIAD